MSPADAGPLQSCHPQSNDRPNQTWLPTGNQDIDELAKRCRYTNCAHESEPDCAVRAAVDAGTLDRDRLENFQALRGDAKRLATKHDALARQEQHRGDRVFNRVVRQAVRRKR